MTGAFDHHVGAEAFLSGGMRVDSSLSMTDVRRSRGGANQSDNSDWRGDTLFVPTGW